MRRKVLRHEENPRRRAHDRGGVRHRGRHRCGSCRRERPDLQHVHLVPRPERILGPGLGTRRTAGAHTAYFYQGANTPAVRQLQFAINNCYGPDAYQNWGSIPLGIGRLSVDGQYGQHTRDAVRDIQNYINSHVWPSPNLQPDGLAGPSTRPQMLHFNHRWDQSSPLDPACDYIQ